LLAVRASEASCTAGGGGVWGGVRCVGSKKEVEVEFERDGILIFRLLLLLLFEFTRENQDRKENPESKK